MKYYFDTSVLLPALVTAHPAHSQLKEQMDMLFVSEVNQMFICTHGIAELYANLTRFPLGRRISPEEAATTLGLLLETLHIIPLSQSDYLAALNRCASARLLSGVIYDALHLEAALKAKVDVFFTANFKDFQRLVRENETLIISSPT